MLFSLMMGKVLVSILLLLIFLNCKSQNSEIMDHEHTNSLINSTSPYLLQHAHNPVNWHPWGDKALDLAKKEKKLILVSIGYAACHWCHVMEHESFEDEEVAKVMNDNFICIKVDREERPDVDHYYMTAVQLMRQQGGWPLNVVAMPDGRPVWGGTYFQKDMWVKNLTAIVDFYRQKPDEMKKYADELQAGIQQVSLTTEVEDVIPANAQLLVRAVDGWKDKFDTKRGGRLGQPKFPMPVNQDFLLYYGFMKKDQAVLDFVNTTLEQMARGGIYDQAGGGFARYSVDAKWKVPHFEKMLYDNGQLISLYAKGYQQFKNEEFKTVVYETVDFLERELMDESGAFYSSLDADSEGEEGKFYVWNKKELQEILSADFELFAEYFNVNSKGFWEHGNYILLRDQPDEEFAEKHDIALQELRKKVKQWKEKLMKFRSDRVRPGLDDKTLTSWNALVIQGLTDAYMAFHDEQFLTLAKKNARFLKDSVMTEKGKLYHTWKNGKSSVDGFMEDYALLIQAFISLFETTGNVEWLNNAKILTEYSFKYFYNSENGLFYYSAKENSGVLTNHYQNEDNVIPAANSVMGNNLHKLYLILGEPQYLNYAKKMLQQIMPQFTNYPMAFANWGTLMLKTVEPYYEIVISGTDAEKKLQQLHHTFQPNVLWAFSTTASDVPVFLNRFVTGKTLIYVCEEGICQLPVENTEKALELIR